MMRHGCSLRIECTHCGRASTMSPLEVYKLHGSRLLVGLTPPRLKCKRCGKKAAKTALLGPVWPN